MVAEQPWGSKAKVDFFRDVWVWTSNNTQKYVYVYSLYISACSVNDQRFFRISPEMYATCGDSSLADSIIFVASAPVFLKEHYNFLAPTPAKIIFALSTN